MLLTLVLIQSFVTMVASLPYSSSDCPSMCSCRLRQVNNQPEDCDDCDVTNEENNNNNNNGNVDDPCDNCDRATHACAGCNHASNDVTINSVTCRNIALTDIPFMTPTIISLLDLSDNKLTRLYSGVFGQVRHVITLRLSNNVISDVGRDSFRSLGYIQRLDLDANRLARLDAPMFTGAETLENLNLSHNRLETIDAAFTRLTNLTRLDLRQNLLTELSRTTFKGLVNLRYLILTDNRLAHIDSRAFRHLEKLVYLVLKGNEKLGLMTFPRFHFNSASLTYVDLSECGYSDVPRGLPVSTRYLQLRRNKLTALTQASFHECPHIYTLVLDDNNITDIGNGTFDSLTRLQQLWMSNNKLRQIPDALHASLERLLLDFNLLTQVSQILPKSSLNQLNTLSLTGNVISKIMPNAFSRLIFLDTLRLDFNLIEYIDSSTFNGLTELRVLQLSNNPIKILGSDCFRGLSSLESFYLTDVSNINVSVVDNVFNDVGSTLVLLDISNSPGVIHHLISEDFNQFHHELSSYKSMSTADDTHISIAKLPRKKGRSLRSFDEPTNPVPAPVQRTNESTFSGLTDLNILGSQLTSLRSDLPYLLPRLLTLQMSSNNWHCNSSLAWFPAWISSNAIVVDDGGVGLHCLTPNSVKGKSIFIIFNGDDLNGYSLIFPQNRSNSTKFETIKGDFMSYTTQPIKDDALSYSTIIQPIKSTNNKHSFRSTLPSSIQLQQIFPKFLPQLNRNTTSVASVRSLQSTEVNTSPQSESLVRSLQKDSELVSVVINLTLPDLPRHHTVTARTGTHYSQVPLREDTGKAIDSHTLIVLTVTVSLTLFAVIVIVGVMICITRRTRRLSVKDESIRSTEVFVSKTSSVGSVDRRKLTSTRDGRGEGSKSTVDMRDVRGEGNKSTVDIVSLLPNGVTVLGQTTVEVMALVPGRDVNHEGPRRVYKWEDF